MTLTSAAPGRRSAREREAMVEQYRSFAESLARRFSRSRDDLEDLRQVALLGLLHAVDRFDEGRGVAFTTFAWSTIGGELRRYRRDHSWGMRVPRRIQERFLNVSRALDDLTTELGRSPTIDELAEHLGETPEDVIEALEVRSARHQETLDGPADSAAGGWLAADERVEHGRVEDRAQLEPLLRTLAPREREIIRLRFTEQLTQAEIGEQLGLSQMHVSRLLRRSLSELRAATN